MTYRSSFSQHNKFEQTPRWWFYEKVLKIPYYSDMCYANAGNVIHSVLEQWYKDTFKDISEAKKYFYEKWNSYQLDSSKIYKIKEEYWLMCIEGINKKIPLTQTELKLEWEDFLGYIDCVDSNNCELYDWKSSKRTIENETEYTKQLKLYSWVYYRQFGNIPKKCKVFYLRYPGSKGELEFVPNEETIKEIKQWYYDLLKKMDELSTTKKLPPKCENCSFWCPYKDKCEQDDKKLIYNLYLRGNYIYIDGPITNLLNKGMNKIYSYELKDAYFIKKAKPYANTIINFWDRDKKRLPIGFIHRVQKTLNDYIELRKIPGEINIIDERKFNDKIIEMPDKFLNGRELRDYQIDAVEDFLEQKIAIIESATGSGKTEIAIELIRKLKCKTLFIVDKIELLNQTKKRIEDTLGIEVGIIGQGKCEIKDITVATIQTLNKQIKFFSDYLKSIRFVIFDETHKVASTSYFNLSHYLIGSEFRLGLSATPYRDDGNDMYINAVTGYICISLSAEKMINSGWLAKPSIIFIKDYMSENNIQILDFESTKGLINEEKNYSKYYENFICNNKERNKLIEFITKIEKGTKILIIVKLIKHGLYLSELLKAPYLHGDTKKEERKILLDKFVNNDLNILIGTISIFSEGLDIPRLDCVINAAGNAGDIKSIQLLGRIMRLFKDKEPKYYDFIDESNFFKYASFKRMRVFKRQSHKVNIITKKELIEKYKGDIMWEDENEENYSDIKKHDDNNIEDEEE